eukprot:g9108.t1
MTDDGQRGWGGQGWLEKFGADARRGRIGAGSWQAKAFRLAGPREGWRAVFLQRALWAAETIGGLYALDRDFARNLALTRESDVTDWGLYFCIDSTELLAGAPGNINSAAHQDQTIDLLPNGRNIPVTEQNKINYIQRLSFHKTTTELRKQSLAFRDGMLRVLDKHWMNMFDVYELNFLISGIAEDLKFDELERVCTYAGGYNRDSPVVRWFWHVLSADFTHAEKQKFLQFVTSCSRAPLLGYGSLFPPFCIHRVPDNERLPTASTCANLLKLPDYSDIDRLREKLRTAIYGGEGFHLS